MPLTPKLKSAWLTALRSGDYTQGQGQLHDPIKNTYCCLGVLCVIAGHSIDATAYDWVRKVMRSSTVRTLIYMNDAESTTFPEIASYIEANL